VKTGAPEAASLNADAQFFCDFRVLLDTKPTKNGLLASVFSLCSKTLVKAGSLAPHGRII
jgi:hypothetical protein